MVNDCNHEILMGVNIIDTPFLSFPKTRRYKCQLCGKEMLILQYKMYDEIQKELKKIEEKQLELPFMKT